MAKLNLLKRLIYRPKIGILNFCEEHCGPDWGPWQARSGPHFEDPWVRVQNVDIFSYTLKVLFH